MTAPLVTRAMGEAQDYLRTSGTLARLSPRRGGAGAPDRRAEARVSPAEGERGVPWAEGDACAAVHMRRGDKLIWPVGRF